MLSILEVCKTLMGKSKMTSKYKPDYCTCMNTYCDYCREEYEQQTEANIEEERLPF